MSVDPRSRRFRATIRRERLLIHDQLGRAVHRLAPEDVVRVLDGDRQDHLEILGEEAVESGVRALERDRIGRRTVVANGALAATAGIVTLWLPGAASAASLDVAAVGTNFDRTLTFTATSGNAGTIGYVTNIDTASGSFIQIVAEASAGGRATDQIYEPGRGRRIAANYDRAALVAADDYLEVTFSNNFNGSTAPGGDGGQSIAVMAGDKSAQRIVVMAGAGGGAGTAAPGGDGDAAGGSYTNEAGGVVTGGSPGSGGTGGVSGFESGDGWSGGTIPTWDPGRDYLFGGIFEPAGVQTTNQSHGRGGGGYGAGGFGGVGVETTESGNVARGGGGGGGGSFVNPAYRVGLVQTGYSTRTIDQRCTVTVYLDYTG
jgi:hypothetical protein